MIIEFIIIILSGAIGFWLGLRTQKEKIVEDIKKAKVILQEKKKVEESAIIKALTPEQLEAERKKKFEEENY